MNQGINQGVEETNIPTGKVQNTTAGEMSFQSCNGPVNRLKSHW